MLIDLVCTIGLISAFFLAALSRGELLQGISCCSSLHIICTIPLQRDVDMSVDFEIDHFA